MPVLTRSSLEDSPLSDLHVLAAELSVDGFRKLRKADLIDAIMARQPGADDASDAEEDDAPRPARARSRRGGRGRSRSRDADEDGVAEDPADVVAAAQDADEAESAARPRRRGGRTRRRDGEDHESQEESAAPAAAEGELVTGVVEVLGNGSGFLRVHPPEPSEEDVYVSAAQVRRCELVSGDRIAGPVRAPRRSERYPSLVRIDTINDRPADEVAEGTPWDELPCGFPTERLNLDADDATLKAMEWLTPIGRGSRVVITGAARAGKTEALRRLAVSLSTQDALEVELLLVGVRPEELASSGLTPVAALSLSTSADAQAQAVERAIDAGKRVAARGGHAVVLIDTLSHVPAQVARRALGAARAITDGGSLTVIATAAAEFGGETTVIALDVALTSTGRLPALDLLRSGALKPELLVGDAGAEAIAQARASTLED